MFLLQGVPGSHPWEVTWLYAECVVPENIHAHPKEG